MVQDKYLLTIILGVYNGEKMVAYAIESCISSDNFDRCQLIIVNDGSTDNSEKVIDTVISGHNTPRDNIEVINKRNGGIGSVYNLASECATGKYIMVLDQDDTLVTSEITPLLHFLGKCETDTVFFNMQVYRRDGRSQTSSFDKLEPHKIYMFSEEASVYDKVFIHNMLFKTAIVKEKGVFADVGYRQMADTMWITRFLSYARTYIYYGNTIYNYYFNTGQGIGLENLALHNSSIQGVLFSLREYYDNIDEKSGDFFADYVERTLKTVMQSAYLGALAETDRKQAVELLNKKMQNYIHTIKPTRICGAIMYNNGIVNLVLGKIYCWTMKHYDLIYVR